MMKWTSHFPGKERNEKCWKKLQTSLLSNGYKSNILKFRSVIRLRVTSERNLISHFLFVKLSCYLPPFCRPCLTYFWYLVNKNKLQKNKNFSQTVFQSQLSLLSSISNEQLICVGALPVFRWLRYKVLQLLSARIFGVARCFTFSCTVC